MSVVVPTQYTFWLFQKIAQKVLRHSPIRMGPSIVAHPSRRLHSLSKENPASEGRNHAFPSVPELYTFWRFLKISQKVLRCGTHKAGYPIATAHSSAVSKLDNPRQRASWTEWIEKGKRKNRAILMVRFWLTLAAGDLLRLLLLPALECDANGRRISPPIFGRALIGKKAVPQVQQWCRLRRTARKKRYSKCCDGPEN